MTFFGQLVFSGNAYVVFFYFPPLSALSYSQASNLVGYFVSLLDVNIFFVISVAWLILLDRISFSSLYLRLLGIVIKMPLMF